MNVTGLVHNGGMLKLLAALLGWILGGTATSGKSSSSQMNEGDYHSGPHGYSPNTGYQGTEYGGGTDFDDGWDDEER